MNLRSILIRGSAAAASALLALAMSAPALPTQAAGPINVVSQTTTPSGCGIYDTKPGLTVYPDLSTAAAAVHTGTIYVCPGTYAEGAEVSIASASKLSIKQAVPGERPELQVASGVDNGIHVSNSAGVTLDGLLVNPEAFDNSHATYKGIRVDNATVTINNMALLGPTTGGGAIGIYIDETAQSKLQPEKISNTYIAGFSAAGIDAIGAAKLSVSAVTIDGTDGGRVTPDNTTITDGAAGVQFDGSTFINTATGSVTSSIIRNYTQGVRIFDTSAVAISGNTLTDLATTGIAIVSDGGVVVKGTKITSNALTRVGSTSITLKQTGGTAPGILSTSISSNRIVARQWQGTLTGLMFDVAPTAAPLLTATLSRDQFLGFQPGSDIVNLSGNASFKQSGNIYVP